MQKMTEKNEKTLASEEPLAVSSEPIDFFTDEKSDNLTGAISDVPIVESSDDSSDETIAVPSLEEIQSERKRIRRKDYYRKALVSTVSVLLVVAAVAVLIATLFLPILQVSGDSMSPTLAHDDVLVLVKTKEFERGDLIGFYYQGKILLKRVIALPEDEVIIDADGNVYVNGEILEENYVTNKELGDCDLEFPYKVPGTSYFVLGDRRSNSVDSRNSIVGAIAQEDIIGKVFIRAWPPSKFGFIS